MKKQFKKDDEEFAIFNEFWHLMQDFWEPEFDDKYWSDFIDALDNFEARHKGNRLCELMIMLAAEYIHGKYGQEDVSLYIKLIKSVRFAYNSFLKDANDKDKALLEEILREEKYASEKDMIMAVARTLALD